MPSADVILGGLTVIANDWRALAIAWHVVLAGLLGALLGGWRPSTRVTGLLLATPVVSVGAMAWVAANPFNGLVFSTLAAAQVAIAIRMPAARVQVSSLPWIAIGVCLVAFAWGYPHFLDAPTWTVYTYAAPLGLIPCPTLSFVIGVTLILRAFRSRAWSVTLGAVGVLYGAIGVFRLGVTLDVVLLAGAFVLALAAWREPAALWSVRATAEERRRRLSGDEVITGPVGSFTHAVTIRRPPADVWPWLAQMGAGNRGGWYSYDWLDNGRRPSAARIVSELQDISVGSLFPALPDVKDGFNVVSFQPERSLVLGWVSPDGRPLVTWSFVLEPVADDATRLLVRVRGASGYRLWRLPAWISPAIVRAVHFVMERRQLRGVAERVEA